MFLLAILARGRRGARARAAAAAVRAGIRCAGAVRVDAQWVRARVGCVCGARAGGGGDGGDDDDDDAQGVGEPCRRLAPALRSR